VVGGWRCRGGRRWWWRRRLLGRARWRRTGGRAARLGPWSGRRGRGSAPRRATTRRQSRGTRRQLARRRQLAAFPPASSRPVHHWLRRTVLLRLRNAVSLLLRGRRLLGLSLRARSVSPRVGLLLTPGMNAEQQPPGEPPRRCTASHAASPKPPQVPRRWTFAALSATRAAKREPARWRSGASAGSGTSRTRSS
jgi:hypothetical protein